MSTPKLPKTRSIKKIVVNNMTIKLETNSILSNISSKTLRITFNQTSANLMH